MHKICEGYLPLEHAARSTESARGWGLSFSDQLVFPSMLPDLVGRVHRELCTDAGMGTGYLPCGGASACLTGRGTLQRISWGPSSESLGLAYSHFFFLGA